ncbi:unnamed protein product [Schistosoma haematobium]|nr:unnamed protein product [Schistosoma haematobium]
MIFSHRMVVRLSLSFLKTDMMLTRSNTNCTHHECDPMITSLNMINHMTGLIMYRLINMDYNNYSNNNNNNNNNNSDNMMDFTA